MKNVSFLKKNIFHGFGVFGPAGGGFGACFWCCRSAAAEFHSALECLYVARRAGISGIALLESNSIGCWG